MIIEIDYNNLPDDEIMNFFHTHQNFGCTRREDCYLYNDSPFSTLPTDKESAKFGNEINLVFKNGDEIIIEKQRYYSQDGKIHEECFIFAYWKERSSGNISKYIKHIYLYKDINHMNIGEGKDLLKYE